MVTASEHIKSILEEELNFITEEKRNCITERIVKAMKLEDVVILSLEELDSTESHSFNPNEETLKQDNP